MSDFIKCEYKRSVFYEPHQIGFDFRSQILAHILSSSEERDIPTEQIKSMKLFVGLIDFGVKYSWNWKVQCYDMSVGELNFWLLYIIHVFLSNQTKQTNGFAGELAISVCYVKALIIALENV